MMGASQGVTSVLCCRAHPCSTRACTIASASVNEREHPLKRGVIPVLLGGLKTPRPRTLLVHSGEAASGHVRHRLTSTGPRGAHASPSRLHTACQRRRGL